MKQHDNNTADYYDKCSSAWNHADPFSSVFTLSGRKGNAEVYQIFGKSVAGGSFWSIGGVLLKKCKSLNWKSWNTGTNQYHIGSSIAFMETTDAAFHSRRHHLLYVAFAIGFLERGTVFGENAKKT